MIVYSNGCSHTAGACIVRQLTYPHAFISSLVGWNLYDEVFVDSNSHDVIDIMKSISDNPHQLIFQAHHGKSNDRIYFETIDSILRLIKMDKKPDYVLVQWSGPNRKVHIPYPYENNLYGGVLDANPHDYFENGIYWEPYASKHTLQLMISLQSFLKSYDIEYVFIPYMELVDNEWLIEMDLLDTSRCTTDVLKGHRNEFRKKCMVCDENGHPDILANDLIVSKILKILDLTEFEKGLAFYRSWSVKGTVSSDLYGTLSYIRKFWNKLGDGALWELKDIKSLI